MSNYILCNPCVKIENVEIFIVPNSIEICFGYNTHARADLECYVTDLSYKRLIEYRLKKELSIELVFDTCMLKGKGNFSHSNPITLKSEAKMKFMFDCPKGLELIDLTGDKNE